MVVFIEPINNWSIFNNKGEDLVYYNNNENFKNELVGLFEKLYSAYKMDTNLRPRSFFRGDLLEVVKSIDDLVKERTGITIRHYYSNGLYACLPSTIKMNNSISRKFRKIYDKLDGMEAVEGCAGDTESNRNSDNRCVAEKIRKDTLISSDSLIELINSGSIEIDRVNGKIYGLPDEFNIAEYANFYRMFDEYELKPDMVAAVLMHEVGHTYTAIEYIGRVSSHFVATIDRVKVMDKSLPEKLKIATGTDVELEEGKVLVNIDKVMKAYMRNASSNLVRMYKRTSTRFENENMADTYAVMMGFGKELSEGLSRMKTDSFKSVSYRYILNHHILLLYLAIISLLSLFVLLIPIVVLMLIHLFFHYIGYLFSDEIFSDHENNIERLKNIRNDIIFAIKTSDIDDKRKLITSLNSVEKDINGYEEPSLRNLVRMFVTKEDKYIKENRELNELINNKLGVYRWK